MTKAADSILAGAREALDFAKGKRTCARVHIPRESDVKRLRRKTGMTQPEFADCFGMPLVTLRGWEQGRRVPDGAARTLLRMVDADPKGVYEIMRKVA